MTKHKRYAQGDKPRFSAAQVNFWTDGAIAAQKRPIPNGSLRNASGGIYAPVANGSGEGLPPFSVLQLTGPGIDPAENENGYLSQIAFEGGAVSEDDTQNFGITQQFQSNNAIGPAAIAGITFARLTGAVDQPNATTVSGENTLAAAASGPCVILFDPGPADEERFALVRIGGGGSAACPDLWQIALYPGAIGFPTSGSFDLELIPSDNFADLVTVSVDHDETASSLRTKLAAEANLLDDNDDLIVRVGGGPLNRKAIYIENLSTSYPKVTDIDWSNNTLSNGGQPYLEEWKTEA